ncbi:hypothetical protein OHB26_20370 [Nocardia sp. NBC_01503]|uniref:hypothetical protein n=1 Tax=Nocardia sp. NBC_01503 TaxID=2975997 RepID=UPI002E7B67A2|nr:hypothetical protein [Nocardia sp. NBC_01503]WTL29363.1 hypothetical protein OHB26_20370 [Nocardia sp. NBC_01503]
MKRAGPLLTLGAAAALGVGLLITDIATDPTDEPAAASTAISSSVAAQPSSAGGSPSGAATPGATAPNPTGSATFPAQADYVAVIPAQPRNITLSVTVTGRQAVAYACDGASVETWLRGAADAGRVALSGKDSELQATLKGDALTGTLTLGERALDFTAPRVQAPAGVYVAQSAKGRDSWIVRPDGSVTGVRRQPNGTTVPAPDLAPDARKVHGDDTDF